MKIHQPKNNTLLLTLSSIVGLLLIGVSTAYFLNLGPFKNQPNSSINLGEATKEEKDAGTTIKQQTIEQADSKSHVGSDPSPTPQPIEGSDKKSVGMEISAVSQNNPSLQVRAFIQTVTNTGTCNISMKNTQGATYNATVEVQALSSSTTCKGFDIPLSELAPGAWTISIDFNNDNLSATTTKEIVIK